MIARLMTAVLRGYKRFVSPLLPQACRYEPTCSVYMREAIEVHGPVKGVWLGSRRLCRWHRWGGLGWDPGPPCEKR